MMKPNILIAEKDFTTRMQLVRTATTAGYQVETTLSVAKLLYNLLRHRFPVVLLGNSIEENIQIPKLLRLMKANDPQVAIILISDDMSLQQVRKARELGIFFHALRPVNPEDWQELTLVMACALKRTARLPHAPRRRGTSLTPRIH
ncbi:MAG: response regulator [Desulfuromonadales bacterium]|nr:response regulator [Desulfuromonadales bacterium]